MEKRRKRRQFTGTVLSNKMNQTAVVMVETLVKHRFYHKYIKRRSKFAAHDRDNTCRVGDRVLIIESRPLSKTKRWRVSQILEKAV